MELYRQRNKLYDELDWMRKSSSRLRDIHLYHEEPHLAYLRGFARLAAGDEDGPLHAIVGSGKRHFTVALTACNRTIDNYASQIVVDLDYFHGRRCRTCNARVDFEVAAALYRKRWESAIYEREIDKINTGIRQMWNDVWYEVRKMIIEEARIVANESVIVTYGDLLALVLGD